ncbi:hypothetical protein MINTM019_08800 [Mycobacterium paraintracellulare]|nr:hypothetical protein MINTM001_11340 [Mycobacterium paraintracellulare]BCO60954.1 hypothetical protein MINTM006_09040 [Mycobacterium intracellulare]BCO50463.1 hypothetical protein MINTM003_09040 [Mycobacterium paraintracellulare]BCO82564.1 hypothetical protein MINTM011_08990 [Mycobacterium paraintracellulare]BCP03424.1 hypothetical protein MINTM019_08800 [Mycobacterium paraintracellulare]
MAVTVRPLCGRAASAASTAAAILALPDGSGLVWLHAVSANPPAMPAAMKPRLVSRVRSKVTSLVGCPGNECSSSLRNYPP